MRICRDLADINDDGRLTRDGFAVAMHLIHGKLAGKEVPASLPRSLIPPSMRKTNGASPFASAFSAPAPPQIQTQESQNLLWDETPPVSASPPPSQTQGSMFSSPPPVSPPKSQTAAQDPFGSGAFGMSCEFNFESRDYLLFFAEKRTL